MSRGLGRIEREILERLARGETHAAAIAKEMEDFYGSSASALKSTLRAIRSLERKGRVVTRRTRSSAGRPGRPEVLMVSAY